MSFRPVLIAAVAAAAAFSTTSSAAPAPLVVDQPGDANAVNGQGLHPALPTGSPGPGSQDAFDVLSVTFEPVKVGGTCTGFKATAEFKGTAGASNSMYRVTSKTDANPTFLLLQFQKDPQYGERTTVRVAGGTAKTVVTQKPAVAAENKITWTISLTDLKEVGESAKTTLNELGATAAANVGGLAYAPTFDMATSDKSFKVCG